jgi:hypothetical protein
MKGQSLIFVSQSHTLSSRKAVYRLALAVAPPNFVSLDTNYAIVYEHATHGFYVKFFFPRQISAWLGSVSAVNIIPLQTSCKFFILIFDGAF